MVISNRTGLIAGYLSRDRHFPISFPSVLVDGVFQKTCTQIGPRYVLSIADRGDLEEVRLRDIPSPLFWPKEVAHYELYKSCTDCLHPPMWHHYEVPETTLEPGETAVDAGAAEGIFALSVADRASKVGIFEPWGGFQRSLHATFGDGAVIRQQALGNSVRTAHLSGDALYGVVSDTEGEPTSVTTLDDFRSSFGPVNFIKADVEGSEHDLLQGAKETILADKPKIAITVYHPGNDWEYMLHLVRSIVPAYQYRVKGLSYNAGKARPVMLHLWV